MGNKAFKRYIRERYQGRGNSWVRIEKDSETYGKIINHLKELNLNLENCDYIKHITREGFAWIRFSKPEGTQEEPISRFEVRYKSSKIDQPESFLLIDDNIAKNFKLLGNTPLKLQLEIDPKDRKQKDNLVNSVKNLKKKSSNNNSQDNFESYEEVKIIKERPLTKPSTRELEEWYEFLKINNLYEENV